MKLTARVVWRIDLDEAEQFDWPDAKGTPFRVVGARSMSESGTEYDAELFGFAYNKDGSLGGRRRFRQVQVRDLADQPYLEQALKDQLTDVNYIECTDQELFPFVPNESIGLLSGS